MPRSLHNATRWPAGIAIGTLTAATPIEPSRREETGAVSRLNGHGSDRTAGRDALVRRQLGIVLDMPRQQLKSALGVRLDQFELREGVLVGLDVVAVLHLVEAVG